MYKMLFIAEKPSLARAIADAISSNVVAKEGYIEAGSNAVTWCFGHLLKITNNEKDKWKDVPLPILPSEWVKKPKDKNASKQIKIIKELIKISSTIVNAGDPDREGQYIVDEVLEYLGYSPDRALRLWVQALDKESINKAMRSLTNNSKYKSLSLSAQARAKADWIVGINFSRLYSLKADYLITIGRVQTPTLKIIAERDAIIENFRPKDYFVLENNIDGKIKASLITRDIEVGTDEEDRLINKEIAYSIAKSTSYINGTVLKVDRVTKLQHPQMPFTLSTLQKKMSSQYGFSAKKTLDVLQSLYEKKLVTYPRTDCAYLPEEQFAESSQIINNIVKATGIDVKPDFSIKHKCWNSSKLAAHHGIIPTKDISGLSKLSEQERLLYDVIIKSYIALFYKPYKFIQTGIIFKVGDYKFYSSARSVLENGFKELIKDEKNETEKTDIDISVFTQGKQIKTTETIVSKKQTTPPSHFTDGTLVDVMSRIHKYIADSNLRLILKETDGLGTEATRAGIIENLVKRGFVLRKGKYLISVQPFVNALLRELPNEIKDPIMTAHWESKLSKIAENKYSAEQFEEEQKRFVKKIIEEAKNIAIKLPTPQKKGKKGLNKKTNTVKITNIVCPSCGKNKLASATTKNNKPYFFCSFCKSYFWDNNGEVGQKWKIKISK